MLSKHNGAYLSAVVQVLLMRTSDRAINTWLWELLWNKPLAPKVMVAECLFKASCPNIDFSNQWAQLSAEVNFWRRSTEPAFLADCLGWRISKWKELHPLQLDKGQVQGGREMLFLDAPFSCTRVQLLLCVILDARLFVSSISIHIFHSSVVLSGTWHNGSLIFHPECRCH